MFEENFKLKHFNSNPLSVKVPDLTLKIIEQFEYLKQPLNGYVKNDVMRKTDKIIASAT